MVIVFVAACAYLAVTRRRRQHFAATVSRAPEATVSRAPELSGLAARWRVLRARSSRTTAAELAPGGIWGTVPPAPRGVRGKPDESPPDSGPRL
jgi:hypothetical protein